MNQSKPPSFSVSPHDAAAAARAHAIGLDVFYPIVPDAAWAARLVPLGLRTVQLRVKDQPAERVRHDIQTAIEVCRTHNCQLIVNDYWREAIALGADFVHLGQEDLADADVGLIKARGLRIGISTHSEDELAIALAAEPNYVALGPIFETKLKAMAWEPQGLERVSAWRTRSGTVPLVGIGGITIERAPGVLASGAQSVSVITDFVTHENPEQRVGAWLAWADTARSPYN